MYPKDDLRFKTQYMLHFTSAYGHVWTVPYPLTKAFEVQNGHGSAQMAHWETQNPVGQMLNHCHYQMLKIVKALEKKNTSQKSFKSAAW